MKLILLNKKKTFMFAHKKTNPIFINCFRALSFEFYTFQFLHSLQSSSSKTHFQNNQFLLNTLLLFSKSQEIVFLIDWKISFYIKRTSNLVHSNLILVVHITITVVGWLLQEIK